MNLLTIKNLSVTYNFQTVLKNFSCEIKTGQIVALIGPNGSGKSSLIKAIAGIIPFEGQIAFADKISRQEMQIGYVPQLFQTDRNLPITVQELLNLSMQTCRHNPKQKKTLILEALQKVDLENSGRKKLYELSGGQLRRILLARAIVHHPKLLLLDEVEAGLDASSKASFYQLIQDLSQTDKVTIILASHSLDSVSKFANKIIEMPKKTYD